jgi:hypothetical protein
VNHQNEGATKFMSFDLRLAHSWEDQGRFVKGILGIADASTQVGLYHGIGHAILDILYGMKEFWPLKKSLVVVTDGDPYLSSCLRCFIRETYNIIQLNSFDIGNVTEWVSSLKTDVLAVIYSGDHAFTGELLLPQELSERLSAKKICSIEIQHSLHAYSKRPVYPWHVQIQHFFPDLAVAIQGARVRMFQHSAPLLDWSYRNLEHELQNWKEVQKEDAEIVKRFEKQFNVKNKWDVQVYFNGQQEKRLWDRSILIAKNLGGDHLIHRIAEKLNIKLNGAGFSDLLETAHFCRWKAAKEFHWWGQGITGMEDFQSLIAISTNILVRENFFNTFTEVLSTCHQESKLL